MTNPLPYQPHDAPAPHAYEQGATLPTPTMPTAIELAADQRIVWVPDAWGRMVPMPRETAPPMPAATPPRDLTPRPVVDPRAQVLVAGGVGVGAAGWGIAQVLSAVAAAGSTALLGLAVLLVAAKMRTAGGGQQQPTGDTYVITEHHHHHNRWWGRSSSSGTTNL